MTHKQTQETVGWMESPHGAIRANPLYRFTAGTQTLKWALPLYLHPAPPQTPMTDEQIEALLKEEWKKPEGGWYDLVRAVERYHGIGEQ